MKTRERLKKLRNSKSLYYRLQLARDSEPGTEFDSLIRRLLHGLDHLERESELPKNPRAELVAFANDDMRLFGHDLAQAIKNGKSNVFRKLADAVDAWHSHKPAPDKIRSELIHYCYLAMMRTPDRFFSIREIVRHLQSKKLVPIELKDAQYQNVRIKIVRICKENEIRISGPTGRPKN